MPLHWMNPDGHCSCGRGIPGHVDHNGNPDYRADHDLRQGGKHPIYGKWQEFLCRDTLAWEFRGALRNVGIATGAASGFWALDWDPAAPGVNDASYALHARVQFEIGRSNTITGGGGTHWFLQLPPDVRIGGSSGQLPDGWDVRGEGGQVVAPPSVSGKGPYLPGPAGLDMRPSPLWLLEMLRPAAPSRGSHNGGTPAGWSPPPAANPAGPGSDRGSGYANAGMGELLAELRHTWSGRNNLAYRVACRVIEFINAGWADPDAAYEAWAAATQAHPDPAILVSDVEVASIWRSAQRRIADGAASLPQMDALPPLPPMLAPGPPPFPAPSMPPGGPSLNGRHAPSPDLPEVVPVDPLRGSGAPPAAGGGAGSPQPAGTASPESDPWEFAVRRAMSGLLAREEAKRRIAEMAAGDRASIKARLRAEIIDTPALLARPRLQPVVEGLLFRNTLVRVVGRPGHGKSFVVLDLAARVAAGMMWAGRATVATRGAYVVAEGDEGFGGRAEAWQLHNQRAIDLVYLPRAVQIGGPEWDAWCEVMAEDGYGFIVIDTQARATVGRDEIDGKDMGEVGAALDVLKRATHALVLLVHHTNMSGGTTGRGHGGTLAALETELYVSMTGRAITVKGGKSKDTALPEDIVFDLVDVPRPPVAVDGIVTVDPRPVPIGVVPVWRNEALAETPEVRESARTARARQLWQVVADRYNPGMGGTQAEIKAAWADVAWAGRPTVGAPGAAFRKAWARAWADLIQRGLLAKAFGASRFKVVVLADQSADGVLTSNRIDEALTSEGPDGFEVIMTDVAESSGEL